MAGTNWNAKISWRTKTGEDPFRFVLRMGHKLRVTVGDALSMGMLLRTHVVERTQDGVDVDGNAFHPYSTNGPYYYNPSGQSGPKAGESEEAHAKREREAVKRLVRKVGGRLGGTHQAELFSNTEPHISRTGRTVVFPRGYAQFKEWLGRTNVDLTGPRAPHMMQSLHVRAGGVDVGPGEQREFAPDQLDTPASEFVLGIYGEPAARAAGHNSGENRYLPQRRFLGASDGDKMDMLELTKARIRGRILGG